MNRDAFYSIRDLQLKISALKLELQALEQQLADATNRREEILTMTTEKN